MSQTHQKLFTRELVFTPDNKRTKIVKDLLKNTEKVKGQLNQNSAELKRHLAKDPPQFAEIFGIMEYIKEIYDKLGDEKKASELAVNIHDILKKF